MLNVVHDRAPFGSLEIHIDAACYAMDAAAIHCRVAPSIRSGRGEGRLWSGRGLQRYAVVFRCVDVEDGGDS
jgi:hypothetical protein